jgi:hypothetical protein
MRRALGLLDFAAIPQDYPLMCCVKRVQRFKAAVAVRPRLPELIANFGMLSKESGLGSPLLFLVARFVDESGDPERGDRNHSNDQNIRVGGHPPFYGSFWNWGRNIADSHDQLLSSGVVLRQSTAEANASRAANCQQSKASKNVAQILTVGAVREYEVSGYGIGSALNVGRSGRGRWPNLPGTTTTQL